MGAATPTKVDVYTGFRRQVMAIAPRGPFHQSTENKSITILKEQFACRSLTALASASHVSLQAVFQALTLARVSSFVTKLRLAGTCNEA